MTVASFSPPVVSRVLARLAPAVLAALAALAWVQAAPALPVVVSDPRLGPSDWAVARPGEAPPGAAGYLVELPAGGIDQTFLEAVVELAAGGAPVLSLGGHPPAELRPYLDGAVLDPAPADLLAARQALAGLPLVVVARDPGEVVAGLAGGAAAVLAPAPPGVWLPELDGLLPEPVPARLGERPLPTALRSGDLATVVALPADFPGGDVTLEGTWYGEAAVVGEERTSALVLPRGGVVEIRLPALPRGGLLVVGRPGGGGGTVDLVEVRGDRLPTAAEVLARHHRAVARQARALDRWTATQRLLVRVLIGELGRSFEVVLEGPAFWQRGVGTDWELARAWVDGVAWNPDKLPDLPLLEPERPRVPPLALQLEASYEYRLEGVEVHRGERAYRLAFSSREGGPRRSGTAWLAAATFLLVELEERADELPGEVRSTSSRTSYRAERLGEVAVALPVRVVADDLLTAFGASTSVHRELDLTDLRLAAEGFAADRAAAWAREHRMLRDRAAGLVPLVPDGQGGRKEGGGRPPRQRFLLGGGFWDPGQDFPIPYAGLQIQDFDWRGRGEQLRLFLAGVVNDGAWSRPGPVELSLRATTQLLAFSNELSVRGREVEEEAVDVQRQRASAGVAVSLGPARLSAELGVVRWDFSRADETAASFAVPADTWEPVAALQADARLLGGTLTLAGEAGRRLQWDEGATWQRFRLALQREWTPFPLARVAVGAEAWTGRHLDRFSAPSPSRFGGVRVRGIPSNRVFPDRLAVARVSVAVPLARRVRLEAGADAAWVREERSGYHARPLSGGGVSVEAPGPWGTLLQVALDYPITVPGDRGPSVQVLLLRPLRTR